MLTLFEVFPTFAPPFPLLVLIADCHLWRWPRALDWFGRLIQKVVDLTMAWAANKDIHDI